MNRPEQEGGAATASSIPDVLGLKHADGSPQTRESCLFWANEAARVYALRSQEREGLLCNFDGDPVEAQMLAEIEQEMREMHAVQDVWQAKVKLFDVLAEQVNK
ncbi:hypothetical protein [Deinococcus fonticola]|uniref:hypothetical protein n=1 Tax=Deinococcus fonticola TaxID=2528713 RepID=UPI0010750DDE|nr:hypothetical protein [Deinococcus fonticola]